MFLKDIGNKIRGQREKRGLKQQDIANALDISPQAVSKWERGENAPDVTVLKPLARLLGVSVDWLLSVHDEPKDTFEASVLVSSIRGAHKKSMGMRPRDFALWANGVFYQLTEVTLRHEGVPVKYMGDQYLCFFSGTNHAARAIAAALTMKTVVAEDIKVGLSSGEIYLGSVGHPDYARPDVMGPVVNMAFLTQEWADHHAQSGVAVTQACVEMLLDQTRAKSRLRFGKKEQVRFRGVEDRVTVCEVRVGERKG